MRIWRNLKNFFPDTSSSLSSSSSSSSSYRHPHHHPHIIILINNHHCGHHGLNDTQVFEELAVDVYDEVDRRETDALWNKTEVLKAFQFFTSYPTLLNKNDGLFHIITIIIVVLFLSSWLLQVRSQNTVPVPFLPVNPDYSATRNQVTVICVT